MERNNEDFENKKITFFKKMYPKIKEEIEKGVQKTISDFKEKK